MTKSEIKKIAIRMCKRNGLINLSRQSLCLQAGIPDGSFHRVMGCSFTEFVIELAEYTDVTTGAKTVTKLRASPKLRKRQILDAAITVSVKHGYQHITREHVAKCAGISEGLVTRYFNTMVQLRRDVMRAAIRDGKYKIVAQGLAANDKQARKAPDELKAEALTYLAR